MTSPRKPRFTPKTEAARKADRYITPGGKAPKPPKQPKAPTEPGVEMLKPFLLDPATPVVPDKRAVGRPSKKTPQIVDQIVELLIEGKSILDISEMDGMPGRRTIMEWQANDDEFRTRVALAREAQADLMDDLVYRTGLQSTYVTAAADNVKLKAFTWRAQHLQPKKYGAQQNINLQGNLNTSSVEMLRYLDAPERELLRNMIESAANRQREAESAALEAQGVRTIEGKSRKRA